MKPQRSNSIDNSRFGPIGPPAPARGGIASPFAMPDLLGSFRASLSPVAPSPAPALSPMATLQPTAPAALAPAPPTAPPPSAEPRAEASVSAPRPSWASLAAKAPATFSAIPAAAPSGPTARQQRASELVERANREISGGGGTPSGTPIRGAYPTNYYLTRRYSSGTLLEAASQWRTQGAQYSARTGHLTDANPHGRYINLERTDPSPTGAAPTRHNVHVPEGKSK